MIEPARDQPAWQPEIPRILERAFPGRTLRSIDAITGGVINGMYRIQIEDIREPFVLRIYLRDPAACRKELDLHRLVAPRVPVPEILYAATSEVEGVPPHAVMRWVNGLTFRQLKERRDPREIAEAAGAIGETLAHIGSFAFDRPGRIDPGLTIGPPLLPGDRGAADFIESCLNSPHTQRRLDGPQRDRVREFTRNWAPSMALLDSEHRLVHSDFGGPNLLLDHLDGRWRVTGVLDWEFAFSGPPLVDVGHMVRYERPSQPLVEPHFSQGFCAAGGKLPDDWFGRLRAVDLMALCEFLTRPKLPESILPELQELIAATLESER